MKGPMDMHDKVAWNRKLKVRSVKFLRVGIPGEGTAYRPSESLKIPKKEHNSRVRVRSPGQGILGRE